MKQKRWRPGWLLRRQNVIVRGVALQSEPAAAARMMEPAFRAGAFHVVEEPHVVKIAFVRVGDVFWHSGQLSAETVFLHGAVAAVGAGDPEHQRVPVDP
jgi:hypothetical protein